MAEIYPLRGSGEFAGSWCDVKTCKNYARFLLSPIGLANGKVKVCGHHVTPGIRGLVALHKRAVVMQEIPGVPTSEGIALMDGQLVLLSRQGKREATEVK